MAIRLGEYVEWGCLYHSGRNSTHGQLRLNGMESPLLFELTGDPGRELIGKALEFEPRPVAGAKLAQLPSHLHNLYSRQIGPTGFISIARPVRLLPADFVIGVDAPWTPSGKLAGKWKRGLVIEWFSQNGRVLIEMADPILRIADYKQARRSGENKQVWRTPPEPESWDPACWGAPEVSPSSFAGLSDERVDGWFPGADRRDEREMTPEDFWAEMELMDDLVCGDRPGGESLYSIITESIPSGSLDQLNDEEAESALKVALSQLALRCVAIHICEHFSARQALLYLRTVVADESEYFPELTPTGFTQNFMTSEDCPQCEAELEAEFTRDESQ